MRQSSSCWRKFYNASPALKKKKPREHIPRTLMKKKMGTLSRPFLTLVKNPKWPLWRIKIDEMGLYNRWELDQIKTLLYQCKAIHEPFSIPQGRTNVTSCHRKFEKPRLYPTHQVVVHKVGISLILLALTSWQERLYRLRPHIWYLHSFTLTSNLIWMFEFL